MGPETLQVNLGHRCNLNCVFCWNHSPLLGGRDEAWLGRRLSEAHTDNIVDALPRLAPGRLLVSGQGETMIHPALERLLTAAAEARIPVSIQTNGVAGPSPEALCELGVSRLLVNLSAATPEGYERTHPGRGAGLGQVLARLEALAELRRSERAPEVTLVAVIQQSNHTELEPLVALAGRVGARAVYLKGLELVPGLESLCLDGEQQAEARQALSGARALAREVDVALDATHLEQVLSVAPRSAGFTAQEPAAPCYMGWYYLRVTCDGEVMFCCKDKRVGHLDDGSLYRTWRSAGYHLNRLAARDGDGATPILDQRCDACSNFSRNRELRKQLGH